MDSLIIEPTEQSAWHRLITEAASSSGQCLNEASESYLVFLMMRYLEKPELVDTTLAISYFKAMEKQGKVRQMELQAVGDSCLLFAGLFPEQASKRLVTIDYFIKIGRSAYRFIADHASQGYANLYYNLSEAFVSLTDVLHATRSQPSSLIEMIERYAQTGSRYAKAYIERESDNVIPLSYKR